MATPSPPSPQSLTAVVFLSPELLQKYEKTMPGLAPRLVDAAIEEISHRRAMEKMQLETEIELMRHQSKEIYRGQIFAFLITLGFAAAGTYVIVNGHPVAGTIFGGVGLGSIVSTFIWGRSSQSKDSASGSRDGAAN